MLRLIRRRPAVATVPTIDDGRAPEPAVQQQVMENQNRAAALWNETERDIAIANIVNEREEIRETRWQMVVLALLAVILLVAGSIYTYNNVQRDRLYAQERNAAIEKPYTPEAIVPTR